MESIVVLFGQIVVILEFAIALCLPIAAVTFVYLSVIKPIIEMFKKDDSTSFRNSK